MKSLSTCFESLLDDDDIFLDPERDRNIVENWIKENYRFDGTLEISDDFVVDCNGSVMIESRDITSLTNGLFRWGTVHGRFVVRHCKNLTTFEGAPEKVDGDFSCSDCENLKSLKGAPKKVGGDFVCSGCSRLTSLEGVPEEVGENFECSGCSRLTSLEGAPKQIHGHLRCEDCKNLKLADSDYMKYKIRL